MHRGWVASSRILCRFWLVGRTGVSGTALTFAQTRRNEIIVGLSDASIHCYNFGTSSIPSNCFKINDSVETNQLQAKLQGYHQSPVCHIATHPDDPLVLTTSSTECILWDSNNWSRKRLLSGAKSIGVLQGAFSPAGEYLVVSFADGTTSVWQLNNFKLYWKLALPDFAVTSENKAPTQPMSMHGAVIALASNHKHPAIYVWDLRDRTLLHEIAIPSMMEDGGIAQIAFVGKRPLLSVLSFGGQLVFVDAIESNYICHMPTPHMVSNMLFVMNTKSPLI